MLRLRDTGTRTRHSRKWEILFKNYGLILRKTGNYHFTIVDSSRAEQQINPTTDVIKAWSSDVVTSLVNRYQPQYRSGRNHGRNNIFNINFVVIKYQENLWCSSIYIIYYTIWNTIHIFILQISELDNN